MTKKQLQTLDFIKKYIKENRYSPNYEEIAEGIGLKSKSGVNVYVNRLADEGHLIVAKDKARGIRIPKTKRDKYISVLQREMHKAGVSKDIVIGLQRALDLYRRM